MANRIDLRFSIVVVVYLVIFEWFFFGPLGLYIDDLSIRKLLFILLFVLIMFIKLIYIEPIKKSSVIFSIAISFFLIFFGFAVPYVNDVSLHYAFFEAVPYLALLTVPVFLYCLDKFKKYFEGTLHSFISVNVLLLSFVVIFCGAFAIFLSDRNPADNLELYFSTVSGFGDNLYIGPVENGGFRVFWLQCIIFPVYVLHLNRYKFKPIETLVLLLAIFFTGSRSLFLGLFAGVAIMLLTLKGILRLISAGLIFVLVYFQFPEIRIFDYSDQFLSESPRIIQAVSLLNLFSEHPILGAGFGASSDVIRSSDNPYSYELSHLALLTKIGLLGVTGVLLIITLHLFRLYRLGFSLFRLDIAVFICMFIVTSTNPYINNLPGMLFVSFLIALHLIKYRKISSDRYSAGNLQR